MVGGADVIKGHRNADMRKSVLQHCRVRRPVNGYNLQVLLKLNGKKTAGEMELEHI